LKGQTVTNPSASSALRKTPSTDYVLTVSCPDRSGLVHAISEFLVEHDCNIVESEQFDDREVGAFFMRVQFEPCPDSKVDIESLRRDFSAVAAPYAMSWRLSNAAEKQRVLIMVSKLGHCLDDLLFRASTGWLKIEIAAVVSNHPDLGTLADNYNIPFHHIPVTADTKTDAEARLLKLVDELDVNLVVLARYMQILSEDLCKQLEGRAINIHHSMLPSFKGARPYEQAHDRGVKVIGATAHYVTANLDEGPIIEQQVARVDHSMTSADLTELGQDTECLALARAVHWHTENRVLLDGLRTVVFQ
jgi:formyltetrahydrofolate deformylase